jgi:ABC-type multidrug transport system ATPase subunit/ABC-type multidrug transport system permease subunit
MQSGQMKLQGLSGYCKPGMMTLCWGAPDSGVSSILALLAGCYRHTDAEITGELLFNGQPPQWGDRKAKRQVGFVSKEAENFATLTVAQTLFFSAKLRLPRLPDKILHFRVGLMCKLLGLSHVRDSMVGSATVRGLSGGERKRLSYACELIVGYSLILCEQPTDGLDQPSALSLMQNFKLTCGAGRSMMTSLATASVPLFELFDFVLLMSKHACIYFGPRVCVLQYLQSQGFEPPEVRPPQLPMALPDFLQALSATPERFWKAHLPIAVRERPLPWMSQFPFFADSATMRVGNGRRRRRDQLPSRDEQELSEDAASEKDAAEEDAAAKAAKYMLQVDERKLARMESSDPTGDSFIEMASIEQPQPPQQSGSVDEAAGAAAPSVVNNHLVAPPPVSPLALQPAAVPTAGDEVFARSVSPPPVPTQRRAWKRLLKGWRASDLNADCAYVLDFDLQPLQPTIGKSTRGSGGGHDTQPLLTSGREPARPSLSDGATSTASKDRGEKDGPPGFLPHRASFYTEFKMCLWRQARFTYSNRGLWLYNWLKTILLALVMGTLFYQMGTDSTRDVRPRFGLMYFVVTFYGNAAIQMISVLLAARSIVTWETFAGYYHPMAYSLALMLVFIPIAAIEMFLFTIIIYPLSGLYGGIASVNFLYMWLMLTLSNLTGRGWILLFTTFLPTQSLANIIAPVFNLLVSACCGYLNPADAIPAGWIWMYYLSYYTYAFRGLSLNEVAGLNFHCPPGGSASCAVQTGGDALQLYSMDVANPDAQKWIDAVILFAFYLGFQLLSALALFTRHYTARDDAAEEVDMDLVAEEDGTTQKGGAKSKDVALVNRSSAAATMAGSGELVHVDEESLLPVSSSVHPVKVHTLSFFNLCYTVPVEGKRPPGLLNRCFSRAEVTQKKLLNDVCGVVSTGQLVALMGTSGAGKSTLLDVIAQKKTTGTITGSILWDGAPLPENFSRMIGLVEQFDSLHPQSTIRETLFFSGRLRLPSSLSDADVHRRVDEMLHTLEMAPQAHLRIGAAETGNLLSPELRKKVSIAVELMADPMVLFLDEPSQSAKHREDSHTAACSLPISLTNLSLASWCRLSSLSSYGPQFRRCIDVGEVAAPFVPSPTRGGDVASAVQ